MKNCEPLVSGPELAMLNRPGLSCCKYIENFNYSIVLAVYVRMQMHIELYVYTCKVFKFNLYI